MVNTALTFAMAFPFSGVLHALAFDCLVHRSSAGRYCCCCCCSGGGGGGDDGGGCCQRCRRCLLRTLCCCCCCRRRKLDAESDGGSGSAKSASASSSSASAQSPPSSSQQQRLRNKRRSDSYGSEWDAEDGRAGALAAHDEINRRPNSLQTCTVLTASLLLGLYDGVVFGLLDVEDALPADREGRIFHDALISATAEAHALALDRCVFLKILNVWVAVRVGLGGLRVLRVRLWVLRVRLWVLRVRLWVLQVLRVPGGTTLTVSMFYLRHASNPPPAHTHAHTHTHKHRD